ncbi:hypothetical protein Tco_0259553 [Tanacetum coccineum]
MSRMQLNSKFVNNMLPEWSRFITEVKLNRGLKESNFDQLYAYLKVHANENRMMMERFIQPTDDPLALVTNNIKCVYDDVDDLALNVDHVFEADQYDAFDSDVDEAPTTQTMFMVNLSSEDPIYDKAGPSYDSNTLFEVQDHDTFVQNP